MSRNPPAPDPNARPRAPAPRTTAATRRAQSARSAPRAEPVPGAVPSALHPAFDPDASQGEPADIARSPGFDPTKVRLSEHFLLSDFLGNHTVYSRGLPNLLAHDDPDLPLKMANAKALCRHFLEPMLAQGGPLSVSYGYISPAMSEAIVHYQDPRKPSHHRWDLGAACDFVLHEWVSGAACGNPNDDTVASAPVALAHEIVASGYPFSRLITYAESPYLCIAVAANEIASNQPRHAFYENRYVPGQKPDYRTYSSASSKQRAAERLRQEGLPHGWRGQGFPSSHGGGRRQFHHIRVSAYSMLSDWLFNLHSVANGAKNIPAVNRQALMDTFYRVGELYDRLVQAQVGGREVMRCSIVSGFVHPAHPAFDPANDWQQQRGWFEVVPPASITPAQLADSVAHINDFRPLSEAVAPVWGEVTTEVRDDRLRVHFEVYAPQYLAHLRAAQPQPPSLRKA
jgi:hypothetical protein